MWSALLHLGVICDYLLGNAIAAKNIFQCAHAPKQDLLLINRTIKQNIQLFGIHVVSCNKEIISKKLVRRYIQRVCNVDKRIQTGNPFPSFQIADMYPANMSKVC